MKMRDYQILIPSHAYKERLRLKKFLEQQNEPIYPASAAWYHKRKASARLIFQKGHWMSTTHNYRGEGVTIPKFLARFNTPWHLTLKG